MAKKKRTRPAANSDSETDPARPRTVRTIIPAEPADAFWEFSKLLSNLLSWATDTVPQPLNVAWREKYKDSIKDVADSTIRSAKTLGDDSLVAKIQKAQRLGFEFAALLCDRPALSTVAVENWTVPRYRQLFDDLSELEREFKRRGDGELPTPPTSGAARAVGAVATSQQAIPPIEPTKEWTDWTQPKVARTWFPSINSDRGWTTFANRLRNEGKLKNHPTTGDKLVSIHRSVFVRLGLDLPVSVGLIPL